MKRCIIAAMLVMAFCTAGVCQDNSFKKLVGDVKVGEVAKTPQLIVPFIFWGGDMATFYANGGPVTKSGSIYNRLGLNIKLVNGDDFVQQVRDYMAGKTPFLRGTFGMFGMASEVIGSDPRTKGEVITQMTWSVGGDHCVARKHIKTVEDLRGKTIAIQQGGPHAVGFLDDVLKTGKLSVSDVKIVWTKDVTGPNGPAELFRRDQSIDACFVVTPDMVGLSGGLHKIGGKAEGNVDGCRVLVSTAEMSRSIADVYACRKDFLDANKELVTKLVAGYLKAVEEVLELKKVYEASGSTEYTNLLKMTQEIFGKEAIPTLEDAHGLLSDCTFVGHPGNVAFFGQKESLHGFEAFNKSVLDAAISRGYANVRCALFPSSIDWSSDTFMNYLTKVEAVKMEKFRAEAVEKEIEELSTGGGLDDRTIVIFTIQFKANQDTFSAEQYGAEYQRVVETLDKYGNAAIAVRGHADPTKTLVELVKAGMSKGVLQRTGSQEKGFSYSLQGRPLDLTATKKLAELIEQGEFDGVQGYNPRDTMQVALNLSRKRAEAVRDSVIAYAQGKGLRIDKTQITPMGVGIREPFIAKPKDMAEAEKNMRVEFRLVRVTAEAMTKSDFDF